eukprot:jgi/Orpsp1_1/1190775/evm.model.d7180000081142.1
MDSSQIIRRGLRRLDNSNNEFILIFVHDLLSWTEERLWHYLSKKISNCNNIIHGIVKKHTPNMENYFIIRTSYAKPSYYLSILYLLTKSLPINKIDWIKTNKIRTFSSSKKLRKNSLKYFNSFRIKTLSSDFIYNSIYSSSSLFFNLCVSWNINGWN